MCNTVIFYIPATSHKRYTFIKILNKLSLAIFNMMDGWMRYTSIKILYKLSLAIINMMDWWMPPKIAGSYLILGNK